MKPELTPYSGRNPKKVRKPYSFRDGKWYAWCISCLAETEQYLYEYRGYLQWNCGFCRVMRAIWRSMKFRCENPKSPAFQNYGGRGIAVCPEWDTGESGYRAFCRDMGSRPSSDHSLDRIDVNGNYAPSNCRWATQTQQCNNTRFNTHISYDGETRTLAEWGMLLGLPDRLIRERLERGWDIESAFYTEVLDPGEAKGRLPQEVVITLDGKSLNLAEWAREVGLRESTLRNRIWTGWAPEEAIRAPLQSARGNLQTELLERIADLYRGGVPVKEIAAKIGRSVDATNALVQRARARGLDVPYRFR